MTHQRTVSLGQSFTLTYFCTFLRWSYLRLFCCVRAWEQLNHCTGWRRQLGRKGLSCVPVRRLRMHGLSQQGPVLARRIHSNSKHSGELRCQFETLEESACVNNDHFIFGHAGHFCCPITFVLRSTGSHIGSRGLFNHTLRRYVATECYANVEQLLTRFVWHHIQLSFVNWSHRTDSSYALAMWAIL